MSKWSFVLATLATLLSSVPASAQANDNRLCDPELDNCRSRLIRYIKQEPEAIDIAFSYLSDLRYVAALVQRHREGLPIRILVNADALRSKRDALPALQHLMASGIPMRAKIDLPPLHWKMMLFHGLQRLELSKANYTAESFVPGILEGKGHPERGWFDEAVLYLSDPSIIGSFRTQFEHYWTDTTLFREFANSPGQPTRRYAPTPIDPAVNFHPIEHFANRVIRRIEQEAVGVDVIEFRIVYLRATDALIAAHRRGARVRVLVEPEAWNNPTFTTHRQSIARLVAAGVPVRYRVHPGLTHEGLVVLHGLQEAIFGSSNLNNSDMLEHNLFFAPGQGPTLHDGQTAFDWFRDQFARKWANTAAFLPAR